MLILQLAGPEVLRYEPHLILDYQPWRLLTGHLVHANWIHFGLNITGLVLCQALTDVRWRISRWLLYVLVLTTGISAGFYLLHPRLDWYVGFSGVLFGLYVLAASHSLVKQPLLSSAILGFIAIKVLMEQVASVNITRSELIGVPVLVDAHLYGVLIAVMILAIEQVRKHSHKH